MLLRVMLSLLDFTEKSKPALQQHTRPSHNPQNHQPQRRPQGPRPSLPGLRVHARGIPAEVPRPDIRERAVAVEKHGVGSDVALGGAEGAEVGVALDDGLVVEPGGGDVEEALGGGEVFVGEGVFGDPDGDFGEAVWSRFSLVSGGRERGGGEREL